jgi:glutathione S-transferase
MITLTAFKWIPPFAQGLARDLRVRWALEEAGLPYETRLVDFEEMATPAYRQEQPFGQVPVCRDEAGTLFESGAILLHLGARSEALLPAEPHARNRAVTWVFAALNTLEPPIQVLAGIDLFHADQAWAQQRRPEAEKAAAKRLAELAVWLGERAYLEDRFTVGDLAMASVLRILRHTDLVEAEPTLAAYLARCEARPAFQRALRDHMTPFAAAEAAPASA